MKHPLAVSLLGVLVLFTDAEADERVHAALKGEPVDRVPFCFWHHFKPEGSGERMAALTMEFFVQIVVTC